MHPAYQVPVMADAEADPWFASRVAGCEALTPCTCAFPYRQSQLLQHSKLIIMDGRLCDTAVPNFTYCASAKGNLSVGCRDAIELTFVRSGDPPARNDPVATGDDLFDVIVKIGKRVKIHRHELFDSLPTQNRGELGRVLHHIGGVNQLHIAIGIVGVDGLERLFNQTAVIRFGHLGVPF